MIRPRALPCSARVTAGITSIAVVLAQLAWPPAAQASHLGSSTASAGSAPPPTVSAVQSFQPDLFTGRATTSIPIAVPPGRKGLQPALALTYSSSGRNSWVGVGWDLDVGYIERSTTHGPPAYRNSDTFTFFFQGATSDLTRPSDTAPFYRAKDEQLFLRFEPKGATQGWEVRDKSGTRYLFGQTVQSQIVDADRVFRWCLDQIIDVNGNSLTITYTKDANDGRQPYPAQIRYTAHLPTGLQPSNQVEFSWEERPDIETSLRSGFPITTAKRLKAIDTKATVNGVLSRARRYELRYTQSRRTGRSLLESVTQIGSDGVTRLPPTVFRYQGEETATYALTGKNDGGGSPSGWNVRIANMNRGHDNYGAVSPYDPGLPWGASRIVSRSSTDRFGCVTSTVDADGALRMSGCQDTYVHAWTYLYTETATTVNVQFGKFSCDTNAGLWQQDAGGIRQIKSGNETHAIPLQAGWTILHVTDYHEHDCFSDRLTSPLSAPVEIMTANPPFVDPQLAGDVDGNGTTDLITYQPETGAWSVSCADTCTILPHGEWIRGFGQSSSTPSTPLVGDWNGDGKTDLATFQSGTWQFATSMGTVFTHAGGFSTADGTPLTGDFNGDGRVDIGVVNHSTWSVALSQPDTRDYPWFVGANSFTMRWGSDADVPLTGDFNGDGLTDVARVQDGVVSVALSNGSAFVVQPQPWATGVSKDNLTTADVNGDGLTDLVRYDRPAGQVRYALSGGTAFVSEQSLPVTFTLHSRFDQLQIGDFNGDGLIDPAIFNNVTSRHAELGMSHGDFPDLLMEIRNGLGGSTRLTYGLSTTLQASTIPFALPVVTKVEVDDGREHRYVTSYSYSGGKYDGESREFRGFAKVEARNTEGHVTLTEFHQDDHLKGRPFNVELRDAAGNLWSRQQLDWQYRPDFGGAVFVFLARTKTFAYDGNASAKQAETRYAYYDGEVFKFGRYDQYGNVTQIDEMGDVDVVGDERHTFNRYTYNEDAWIVNQLAHTKIISSMSQQGGGRTAHEKWFYYDDRFPIDGIVRNDVSDLTPPDKGRLTAEAEYWDTTDPQDPNPVTRFSYDDYGNVTSVTDALGRTTTNTYDQATHAFLIRVKNAVGHTQQFTYDPGTGQTLSTTDVNGLTTRTSYDPLGRPTRVVGPTDTDALPTVRYEYDPCLTSNACTKPIRTTVHRRVQSGQSKELSVTTFTDGLGRTIQTRSPAQDLRQQIVGGAVEWNERGLVAKQWLSYPDQVSQEYRPQTLVADVAPPVTYEYDPMGRVTKTIDPDGTATTVVYDDWTVTATDANGHRTRRTHDAYGRLVKVEEFIDGKTLTTTYDYGLRTAPNSTVYQLTRVEDAAGNVTRLSYDTLGRKVLMIDPDMGRWTYTYDAVGNLLSQTDARWVTTVFTYDDLNRLIRKEYVIPSRSSLPSSDVILPPSQAPVEYTYDNPAKPYSKGKLTEINDGPGSSSSFDYDQLGRLVKESKTIDGRTSTIARAYDLLGRLTRLTYPDGSAAIYAYNDQGGVDTVDLASASQSLSHVVTHVGYNATGQLTRLEYGNGTATNYGYDAKTLRLAHLETRNQKLETLQDFSYTFDPVGNVKAIRGAVASLGGGTHDSTQTFDYDPLNRLVHAGGPYGDGRYAYDAIGNLTEKEGVGLRYDLVNEFIDPTGGYQKTKPHAVTSISDGLAFEYDKNGNLTRKLNATTKATVATLSYDTENRLIEVNAGDAPTTQPITLVLQAGWNFVSLPARAGANSIAAVFGDQLSAIRQVSRFNPTTQAYDEHFVNDSAFNQFDIVEAGRGYAVYAARPIVLTLNVIPPAAGASRSLTAPTTASSTSAEPAAVPGQPRHRLADGDAVYHMVNLAWGKFQEGGRFVSTYGMDFGRTAWGNYGVATNPLIGQQLADLSAAGVEGVRWFVIPDGRNLTFSADGTPTGRAPGFQNDLWTALDRLDANRLSVVFTLIDGNTWCDRAGSDTRVPAGGHADVLRNVTKRQALYASVLTPILQDLAAWKTQHPDRPFPVAAIDAGNELSYGLDQSKGTGVASADIQAYVREAAAVIHRYLPGVPVTVGEASAQALVQYWTDQALGVTAGQGLDFYSFHHYGSEPLELLNSRYRLAQLGKRVYLQEFPGRGAPLGLPETYLSTIGGRRNGTTRAGWLSGSWLWSVNGADNRTPADPLSALRAISDWLKQAFPSSGSGGGAHLIGNLTAQPLTVAELLNNLRLGVDIASAWRYNGTRFTALSQSDVVGVGEAIVVRVASSKIWNLPGARATGGAGGTTQFVYDGDGGRVKQITPQGTTVFLGQSYELGPDGTATTSVFVGSQRVAAVSPGRTLFYHGDHLGSTSVVTDGTGSVVEVAEYRPFGALHRREGSGNVPQKFTGQRLDASTGLYFYNARYYDPTVGRFIQADPMVPVPGDSQALNRYSYCRNNPVTYTDPSGHGWFRDLWRGIVGVASTAVALLLPPLAPAMWALNIGLSAASAIQSGNAAGFFGGLVGGTIFGAIGEQVGLGMSAAMGEGAYTFLGGALAGAAEFGLSGFGAGFGAALASGASFGDAFKAGGAGAVAGAVVGAAIQSSYVLALQTELHGTSVAGLANQGVFPQSGNPIETGVGTQTRARSRYGWNRYLHGTDENRATSIKLFGLNWGSYVTAPEAVDPVTGKIALQLTPAAFRRFISQPRLGTGDWFVDVLAPKQSVVPLPPTEGGAPQWRIYGEHVATNVRPNPNY